MAKVTITFEDIDDGVRVKAESEPPFPGPAAQDQTLTEAQEMGIRMTQMLTEELQRQEQEVNEHDHCGCGHDHDDGIHDHDDGHDRQDQIKGQDSVQSNQ